MSNTYWWQCAYGHAWEATLSNRIGNGSGCPYCAGKRATSKRNLAVLHPELVSEWSDRNPLPPSEYTPVSNKEVWWVCSRGHEWSASIQNRANGHKKCKICSSIATTDPDLCVQWHPRNGALTPEQVTRGCNKKVWWKCPAGTDHVWLMSPSHRAILEQGCPMCAGRQVSKGKSLLARFPEVAREWHPTKNDILPERVMPGSHTKVWWECAEGHEWEAPPHQRTGKGSGCPTCYANSPKPYLRLPRGPQRAICTVDQVQRAIIAYHAATGRWPTADPRCRPAGDNDATVYMGVEIGWRAVDAALKSGCRGLPGGGSLRQMVLSVQRSAA